MPKLVGGPTYSRPPVVVERTERPPDPDDLPLMSEWTPEDHELAAQLGLDGGPRDPGVATASAPGAGHPTASSSVTWSAGSSTTVESGATRRGLGGLFRGKERRPRGG